MKYRQLSMIVLFYIALLACSVVPATSGESSTPVMLSETFAGGQVDISPAVATAGQFGTWVVSYTVGDRPIRANGGIRLQMPDPWHAGPRNSALRLQTKDPSADQYITAAATNPLVKLNTVVESETDGFLVKHSKISLDGRSERYVYVVRVVVAEGALEPGDRVSIVYGDRGGGSAGYRAGVISTRPLPFLLAVDWEGTNEFQLVEHSRTIAIRPGSACEMMLHLPSQAILGQPVLCTLSLVDFLANPIDHMALVQLRCASGSADLPAEVLVPAGKGYTRFEVIPTSLEPLRIQARAQTDELAALSNPCRVYSTEIKEKIYWGDTHSHTHYSWDGVGDDSFNYARYISGLDFYAMTDHANSYTVYSRGLNEDLWDEYTATTDRFNDPPRFVTLHAYECSLGSPYGHHNVYFKDRPGKLVTQQNTTLNDLWSALSKGEALTIPHHTGKFPSGIDFSLRNTELRRNIELYSGHGLSEAYNPLHPLAFEQSLFTSDAHSSTGRSYAQDAWISGLLLSSIASSDDHRAHPGQPHYGLAAVRASSLSREAIFQGLYNRNTYATTGAKIILDLSANGAPMGGSVKLTSSPVFHIEAYGTDLIDWVELLRYDRSQTNSQFQVIRHWRPHAYDFTAEYTDPSGKPGSIYYVRLKQKNQIRGRAVMAWSSPIWFESDH